MNDQEAKAAVREVIDALCWCANIVQDRHPDVREVLIIQCGRLAKAINYQAPPVPPAGPRLFSPDA